MKGERMAKRSSFGAKMRKRLSDITNSQSHNQVPIYEEKPLEINSVAEEYVNKIIKEKMTLVRLLEERNKIIELSGAELQNLRVSIHKLQIQNWTLAQSNSQFLAEINLARDKMKALQHEIMCKDALLKAKNSQLEGKSNEKPQKHEELAQEPENNAGSENIEAVESLDNKAGKDGNKPSNQNRRGNARSQSMAPPPPTAHPTAVTEKEKAENTRRRLRRQSARFSSQEREINENLFEIEDIKLTVDNDNHHDSLNLSCKSNAPKEEEKESGSSCSRTENHTAHRSSIGRPLRRAVEKVQSYKEVPVNIKMRRAE